MKSINLTAAGIIIQIRLHSTDRKTVQTKLASDIEYFYKDFVTADTYLKPQYFVDISDDIMNEFHTHLDNLKKKFFIKYCETDDKRHIKTSYWISVTQLQFIIFNILQSYLTSNNGFLLHASANIVNNKVFLFLAPSGGGKSTIKNRLAKIYPPLADDFVIIKKEGGRYLVYPTLSLDKQNRLKKITTGFGIKGTFFLKKHKNTDLRKFKDNDRIFSLLSKQIWVTELSYKRQMKNILEFIPQNNFYILKFEKDGEKVSIRLSEL